MRRMWTAVVAAVVGAALAGPASAAVLCQKKNRVKVRAEACKGKEVQIQDLAAVGAGADAANRLFQTTCPRDAERTLVVGTPPFLFAGDECGGGCRVHDGDQAACEASFQVGWEGPTACAHLDGKCVPCKGCGERAGRCIDACEPRLCADAARTVFKGGPGTEACRDLPTEGECEAAWAMQSGRTPVSCYWDAGAMRCFGCGEQNEDDGFCTNVCRDPDECADPGRAYAGYCGMFDGDETGCNGAYTRGGGGSNAVPYTCYYDGGGNCRECRTVEELLGRCADTCDAWP